jgi:hypothetical protein
VIVALEKITTTTLDRLLLVTVKIAVERLPPLQPTSIDMSPGKIRASLY